MSTGILDLAKRHAPPSLKNAIRQIRTGIRMLADSSQNGEVAILKGLVSQFVCKEVLIDVGANDGVTLSNSLPFVKRGFRAILIEPSPKVFLNLRQYHAARKNVVCLQLACLDRTGECELYYGSDGDEGFMSTCCQANNE